MHAHTRSPFAIVRRAGAAALAAGLALSLAACAPGGSEDSARAVTLIVHDSFVDGDAFAEAASAATGYDVKVITAGDGGELTNKLVLTQGAPVADAFFGVDNAFASRLIDHEVTAPFAARELPDAALDRAITSDGGIGAASGDDIALAPIDFGAVCINIDTGWFAERGIAEPASYEDLADPAYRDLTVLIDPTGSSTGAAFLVGTVSAFGEDGFADYWKELVANGARIEAGWTEAYNGRFTAGGGDGTFPIALSYSSSPAWTLTDDGSASTTAALLDTCTSQVEYAGVIAGAANAEGAQAVVDYLLSREFQDTIADGMYMYPIDPEATVSDEWKRFAPAPTSPHDLAPAEIGAGLEGWLKTWSAAVS